MDNCTRAGIAGGTFLTYIANLCKDDILKIMELTMIGAVVSFVVSIVLQCIIGLLKRVGGIGPRNKQGAYFINAYSFCKIDLKLFTGILIINWQQQHIFLPMR